MAQLFAVQTWPLPPGLNSLRVEWELKHFPYLAWMLQRHIPCRLCWEGGQNSSLEADVHTRTVKWKKFSPPRLHFSVSRLCFLKGKHRNSVLSACPAPTRPSNTKPIPAVGLWQRLSCSPRKVWITLAGWQQETESPVVSTATAT